MDQDVPFIGDFPEGPILLGGIDCIPMPTALAHIYCDEGFVLAADGRNVERMAQGMKIISDREQKIFRLPGVDRDVACSFCGMVDLFDDASSIAFDFVSECQKAAESLTSVFFAEASDLADRIGQQLQQSLIATKERGAIVDYPSGKAWPGERRNTIVRIHLDGYFSGLPFPAVLRLGQENQQPFYRSVSRDLYPQHSAVLFGSPEIAWHLFHDEDARLARYRTDATRRIGLRCMHPKTPVTLQDSIEAAHNYIAACCDPIALEIDEVNCQGIGGHLHIAAVTPKDGFYWVERP